MQLKTNKRTIGYSLILIVLLITSSCKEKSKSETSLTYSKEQSEILIDKFPLPRKGITGFNSISYPNDFSFDQLDEDIYNQLTNKSLLSKLSGKPASDDVLIKVRYLYKDIYGKDSLDNWIVIGSWKASEAMKYADFQSWHSQYQIFTLLKNFESSNTETQRTTTELTDINTAQPQNIISRSNSKLDKENGWGKFKLGASLEQIKGIANISYNSTDFQNQNLITCQVDDVGNYNFYHFPINYIYLDFDSEILVRITIALQDFDAQASSNQKQSRLATGNLLHNVIAKEYGNWNPLTPNDEERDNAMIYKGVINGNKISLVRNAYKTAYNGNVPNNLDLDAQKPLTYGDHYIYSLNRN
ncbi:hypothetical protein ACS5PU_08715 [Pedobacter sp. GSP4]|uniref:hypothetical protein n=1 Tax=Pedobacter sp. GSP4 TaxID=3453716 RepID=UPI003EEB6651